MHNLYDRTVVFTQRHFTCILLRQVCRAKKAGHERVSNVNVFFIKNEADLRVRNIRPKILRIDFSWLRRRIAAA